MLSALHALLLVGRMSAFYCRCLDRLVVVRSDKKNKRVEGIRRSLRRGMWYGEG